jgi:hypothetical protein
MFGDCPDTKDKLCPSQYVEWMRQSLEISFDTAFHNLKVAASRQKKAYEKGLKSRQFTEHNLVWRWYPPIANTKLGLGWTGPYTVIKRITDVTYTIEHVETKKRVTVHIDHLKPYQGTRTYTDSSDSESEILNVHHPNYPDDENEEVANSTSPDDDQQTEVTPYVSRAGRRVKPKIIFSPS